MKKITRFLIVLLLVFVSACQSLNASEATPSLLSPSTTPNIGSTHTPTASENLSGQPEEISLCPDNQMLLPADFMLTVSQGMIMIPENADLYRPQVNGYWTWGLGTETTSYIPLFPEDDVLSRISSISPDGNWLLFQRWHEDDGQRSLWISSSDGDNQWQVGQFGRFTGSTWISDQEIVIIGPNEGWPESESPRSSDLFPLMIMNPFSMDVITLPLIPATPAEGIFDRIPLHFFRDGERSYSLEILYDGAAYGYYLYDYSIGDYRPVFQWLNSVSFLETDIELLGDGTFFVVVMKPGGIDVSSRLNMDDVSSDLTYEEVMQFIAIPEQQDSDVGFWKMSADANLFAFRSATTFYMLNFQNMTFMDYCLGSENLDDLVFSPDGRYVALTYRENPGLSSGVAWIVIVDLETGYMTQIDDYQMIGWHPND